MDPDYMLNLKMLLGYWFFPITSPFDDSDSHFCDCIEKKNGVSKTVFFSIVVI